MKPIILQTSGQHFALFSALLTHLFDRTLGVAVGLLQICELFAESYNLIERAIKSFTISNPPEFVNDATLPLHAKSDYRTDEHPFASF